MKALWLTIFATSGAKIYGLLLGIASLSLTSRHLGPEGRGTVVAVTTWVSGFMTVGYLSLGQVALHRISEQRNSARYGAILGSLLAFAGAATAIGWLVALALSTWRQGPLDQFSPRVLVLAFLSLPFLIWEQYGSSLLVALERLDVSNKYQVIGRTIAVVALYLLLVTMGWTVDGAIMANLVGQAIVSLGGLRTLIDHARSGRSTIHVPRSELAALLLGGCKLHINAIGTFMFSSANVLLLHRYSGASNAGLFSLASQLVSMMLILPQSASMVTYGRVARLGADGAWPSHRRLVRDVTLVMLAASALAAFLSPFLIDILAGPAFADSTRVFRWLLLTIPGGTVSAIMAPQWIGRGYFVGAAGVTLATGLLSLSLGYTSIPRYGVDGAVGTSIASYTVALAINAFMYRHCEVRSRLESPPLSG